MRFCSLLFALLLTPALARVLERRAPQEPSTTDPTPTDVVVPTVTTEPGSEPTPYVNPNPFVTPSNPDGWNLTNTCEDPGDGRPLACVAGLNSGVTGSAGDCVSTSCNLFLVLARLPNPCLSQTASTAYSCKSCDVLGNVAALRGPTGADSYVSGLSSWCTAAPRCTDVSSGSKLTTGDCAVALVGGTVGGSGSTAVSGPPSFFQGSGSSEILTTGSEYSSTASIARPSVGINSGSTGNATAVANTAFASATGAIQTAGAARWEMEWVGGVMVGFWMAL